MITLSRLFEPDSDLLFSLIDRSRSGLKNLNWSAGATIQSTRDFLVQKATSKDVVFGIFQESTLVGVVELRNKVESYELGYWLGSEYQHCGIMLQAVGPLVLGLDGDKPVTAHIRAGNHASKSVLVKSGMIEHHREMWQGEEWVHYSNVIHAEN